MVRAEGRRSCGFSAARGFEGFVLLVAGALPQEEQGEDGGEGEEQGPVEGGHGRCRASIPPLHGVQRQGRPVRTRAAEGWGGCTK